MVKGSVTEPGVYMESVHYLMKLVAGAPNIRPPWFFDTAEQGEGVNDIGTHLVDLVQWTLFPSQPIDYRTDVSVLASQRWPTTIPEQEFQRVTREPSFPQALSASVKEGKLEYYCNTLVSYTVRGVHTKLNVIWDWEPPAGSGDTHFAFYRGTRARVEVRQGKADGYKPELYVIPVSADAKAAVLAAVKSKLASLQSSYPGVAVEDRGAELHVTIPDTFRVGHEAHFAQVTTNFLQYLPRSEDAAGVGASQHAGEVLRDDKGGRDEPAEPAERRSAARALSRRRTSRRVARRTNLPDAASYISERPQQRAVRRSSKESHPVC